jgi:hypothetical protein
MPEPALDRRRKTQDLGLLDARRATTDSIRSFARVEVPVLSKTDGTQPAEPFPARPRPQKNAARTGAPIPPQPRSASPDQGTGQATTNTAPIDPRRE